MPNATQYGSYGSTVIKTGWGYGVQNNVLGGIGYGTVQQMEHMINQNLPTGTSVKIYDRMEDIQNMKTLYNVVVVDLDGELIIDIKIVAENEEEAKFESGVYEVIQKYELKLNEVTIICTKIGTVKSRPVKD